MFINCPNCSALVATDLATGQPPERCSRCGFGPLAEEGRALPAFPPAPLAPAPDPEPVRPQAKTVFIPLTPSRPSRPAAGDEPPAPPPTGASEPDPALAPAQEVEAAGKPGQVPAPPPPAAVPAPPEPGPDSADPAIAEPPPETARQVAPPTRPAPRFLARAAGGSAEPLDRRHVAVAAGLAVLLVVQLLLADRDRLAGSAAWRPLVVALCAPLPCSVPPWRDPAAISVQERDVRPAPERPGVLRVSATIHNQARWAQAWPRLVLTFSDLDGRALGMRAFEPAEYLAAPPADVTIASGQQAAIAMDIVEPSPHAVAFHFDFR